MSNIIDFQHIQFDGGINLVATDNPSTVRSHEFGFSPHSCPTFFLVNDREGLKIQRLTDPVSPSDGECIVGMIVGHQPLSNAETAEKALQHKGEAFCLYQTFWLFHHSEDDFQRGIKTRPVPQPTSNTGPPDSSAASKESHIRSIAVRHNIVVKICDALILSTLWRNP